jgi:hypothetical protein
MGKSSVITSNELLPEFQKFLLDRKLAHEKNAFFPPRGPVIFSDQITKRRTRKNGAYGKNRHD